MEELLRRNAIDAVVHFSGNAYVGESMTHPEAAYPTRSYDPHPDPDPRRLTLTLTLTLSRS